jgi:hypothetical protein
MERFAASDFYKIARALELVAREDFSAQDYARIGFTGPISESLQNLGLTLALAQVKRMDCFVNSNKSTS